MSDKLVMTIIFLVATSFIFALELIMPKLTRRNLFFGVRIPEDKIDSQELKGFYKSYIKKYIILCGGFIAVLVIILVTNYNDTILTVGILLYVLVSSVVYYSTFRNVKKFKEVSNWNDGKKEAVIVDISFRNDRKNRILVSPAWFIIPLVLILINLLIGLKLYDKLPGTLPVHWNGSGQIDRWAPKSITIIYELPLVMLFLTGVMFLSYKAIGWAKQQISVGNPETTKEQNRRFRLIWSKLIVFMNIIIALMFTFLNLNTLGVIKSTPLMVTLVMLAFLAVILIPILIIALKTGQGGSRIKLDVKSDSNKGYIDREDDKYWKLGMLYYNPGDPAYVVEKRFGIGWTINFGRPLSIAVVIGIIILAIGLPAIIGLIK